MAFCERIEQNNDVEICSQNYAFNQQPIDNDETFSPAIDNKADIPTNRKKLNQFDYVDPIVLHTALDRAAEYALLDAFQRKKLDTKSIILRIERKLQSILKNKNPFINHK